MIERQFIEQRIREFEIEEYFSETLKRVGLSHTKVQRTPLGDKVIIFASRPGLIIGRQGANIKSLTKTLKNKFKLENPQIEINEIGNVNLDVNIVAESIANSLERFGTKGFKGIGHKIMTDVMGAKALGVEILISGKIPSSRAKTWRFYQGYLKKCGDIAITGVDKSYKIAKLKSGIVGIKVSIMPPSTKLPYHIELLDEPVEIIEEVTENEDKTLAELTKKAEEVIVEKKPAKKKTATKKTLKKTAKKNEQDSDATAEIKE